MKEIRLSCSDVDNSTVTFEFDATEMTAQEMFMQWVRFMNAIGYVLDPEEMEDMWNGIPPEELEYRLTTRNIIAEFEYQLLRQGIDHSNDPKWVNAREWCFKQWPSNEFRKVSDED